MVLQDGKVVFVRHGSIFVRVSPNRLQKVDNYLNRDEEIDDNKQEVSAEKTERETQAYQKIFNLKTLTGKLTLLPQLICQ